MKTLGFCILLAGLLIWVVGGTMLENRHRHRLGKSRRMFGSSIPRFRDYDSRERRDLVLLIVLVVVVCNVGVALSRGDAHGQSAEKLQPIPHEKVAR